MRPEDFATILPYGLMVGGHVTPIDHQYFTPRDMNSPRDAYEVRAMADSRIATIQPRSTQGGVEYRMTFSVTCTFLYYYDLVTKLAPDVQAAYDRVSRGGTAEVDLPVAAGQRIGWIGGQTLDFAVFDTTQQLTGLIDLAQYRAEPWKQFTVDPLEYYTDELQAFALSRYVRSATPRSGKFDHDVDGRLIGNWFQEGTNGYGGPGGEGRGAYWAGHLAFAPDYLDPTRFVVSIGADERGQTAQYMGTDNNPDPRQVSVVTGPVAFDLTRWDYFLADGRRWDRTQTPGVRARPTGQVVACALVQMIEDRRLRFEVAAGGCPRTPAFTAAAKVYTR